MGNLGWTSSLPCAGQNLRMSNRRPARASADVSLRLDANRSVVVNVGINAETASRWFLFFC